MYLIIGGLGSEVGCAIATRKRGSGCRNEEVNEGMSVFVCMYLSELLVIVVYLVFVWLVNIILFYHNDVVLNFCEVLRTY